MAVPDAAVSTIKLFCEVRTAPELRDEMRLEVDLRGTPSPSLTVVRCGREPPGNGPE